uniref:Uncharacterized protein n=1 Tax=Salmonella typhimurium TaxID=90371 RepID=A0A0P0CFP4_SALTM|nr:hypothetical protein [Salmonella enterica subsp. enterica serovar Typhimurium]
MISLSPPTICNSASFIVTFKSTPGSRFFIPPLDHIKCNNYSCT